MKTTTLLLLLAAFLFSQNSFFSPSKTYAVVIGISKYESSKMPFLTSPEKDALSFTAWLKSKAGGQLEDEQINLLINEQATAGKMVHALDRLLEISQKGDKAFIWFSGYGAGEDSKSPPLYLLPYDVPPSVFSATIFPFAKFIEILSERAIDKGVQLILITETFETENLSAFSEKHEQQAGNLLKSGEFLLTPQFGEDELTADAKNEKELRTFSHYLTEGMMGLADSDSDYAVRLEEIKTWLESKIGVENLRNSKFYFKTTHEKKPLVRVDERVYDRLKNRKDDFLPALVQLETHAFENKILQQADQKSKQLFQDFVIAVRLGNLLYPDKQSADYFYKKLLEESSLKGLHNAFRRRLAAALQDESQQAVNAYLRTDAKELSVRWKYNDNYANFPKYMARAVELLGEQHYLTSHLKAKQLYFEGVSIRLDGEKKKEKEVCFKNALTKQQSALKLLPEAAFIHNETGLLFWVLHEPDSAIYHFQRATVQAPTWSIPRSNLCMAYTEKSDFETAIDYGKKAVQLNPEYVSGNINLGIALMGKRKYGSAEKTFKQAIESDPDYPISYYNLACCKALQKHKKQALRWLELALQKGYNDFEHLENDADLETLHGTHGYKSLIFNYFNGKISPVKNKHE